MTYQPNLPVADLEAVAEIRGKQDLSWFHSIALGDYITPGFPYGENWLFVSQFLARHRRAIEGSEILEPGCADGLWTCWLTKLGAKHIDSSDIETREQFRLIARAFKLPVDYYPGIISGQLPKSIRRPYDMVASLGLLYHVHDPLTTLVMYVRYLRDGGCLLLETGAIQTEHPYLHYTGRGEIYGKDGNNQFIPTTGFLSAALSELGMTLDDSEFRPEGSFDSMGKPVGRVILAARKTGGVGLHHYHMLLDQLDMRGPEFPQQRWYEFTI
jgi:SAM-dependent methyltransferase